MNDYCLSVTYKCNWDCDYCCVDTHSQKEPTEDQVLSNLDNIQDGAHVSFSGGEPGLMSESLLVTLLDRLEAKNCVIGVNTNGMFFKQFPQYVHRINDFRYHCSLDLRNKVWLPDGHENMIIKYVIVVTDESYARFGEFLKRNEGITFTVYSADKAIVKGDWGATLSPKNRIDLYKNYGKLINHESIAYLFSKNDNTSLSSNLIKLTNL